MGVVERSLEIRKKVLFDSLGLEESISKIAAMFFGIVSPKDSYCFGNTSKALSFNQKIYLLIDIGVLEKESQKKFLKFMEIRNQFMHNAYANNFVNCTSYIEGAERFLLANYKPDSKLSREDQLQSAYEKLILDIFGYIVDLQTIIHERLVNKKDPKQGL
ncbi:hypothetical protein [Mucilaginibacter lappiensis]|uniref:Mannitol repressor n=1 Tax=Mucilaginibacter lappiensis TaxID=354630 RepID=A0A841JJJ6_9SPHI|nr:hypothetical protein [Mucilaginibacter lappiensis]MBB6131353.1 hypothetical protein [Mucilaginibacter lappiensis]